MKTKQVFEKIKTFVKAAGNDGFTTSGEVRIYTSTSYISVKVGDCEIVQYADKDLAVTMPLGTDYESVIEATTTAMELYLKSVTDALAQ